MSFIPNFYGSGQMPNPQMAQFPQAGGYMPQPQPSAGALISVNGMDGAKAYQMPNNSKVALFDANDDIFYLKTCDGNGFCTLTAFRFEKVEERPDPAQDFVTRDEFQKIISELKGAMSHGE